MPFTDAAGNTITDVETAVTLSFKAVVPKSEYTLTEKDVKNLPAEYSHLKAGDRVSSGLYEVVFKKARADVYTDYMAQQEASNGTYIRTQTLIYPTQEDVYQDGDGNPGGGTIAEQVKVEERPIRQRVRINKDIKVIEEKEKSVWYCLNCGYENADGVAECGYCGDHRTTEETKRITYSADTCSAVHKENLDATGKPANTDWLTRLLGREVDGEKETEVVDYR